MHRLRNTKRGSFFKALYVKGFALRHLFAWMGNHFVCIIWANFSLSLRKRCCAGTEAVLLTVYLMSIWHFLMVRWACAVPLCGLPVCDALADMSFQDVTGLIYDETIPPPPQSARWWFSLPLLKLERGSCAPPEAWFPVFGSFFHTSCFPASWVVGTFKNRLYLAMHVVSVIFQPSLLFYRIV